MNSSYAIKINGDIKLEFMTENEEDWMKIKQLDFFYPYMTEEDWDELKKEFGALSFIVYREKENLAKMAITITLLDGVEIDLMRGKKLEEKDTLFFMQALEYIIQQKR